MATGIQVVIDCADPERLSEFWAAALGYRLADPPPGFASWQAFLESRNIPESDWNSASAVVDPDGKGPRFYFQRVPEAKAVKNRLHVDLAVTGGPSAPLDQRRTQAQAESRRLQTLGARELSTNDDWRGFSIVMQDPEGNEFCLH
ncbi:MAG: VOC family protein [Chloroflexi bacterium]|nr:VOC family protein [Chloroflexota bacterium]